MRLCDSYKCKRLALGMTQAEFGKLVGVSGCTISRFEQGEELSTTVFAKIRYGIEEYIKSLSREQYIETRILEEAFSLRYETNTQRKIFTLSHMTTHIGKLNMDLLK